MMYKLMAMIHTYLFFGASTTLYLPLYYVFNMVNKSINDYFLNTISSIAIKNTGYFLTNIANYNIIIYGDTVDKSITNNLFLPNHRSHLDFYLILNLMSYFGCSCTLKFIAVKFLKYIPFMRNCMLFKKCILIESNRQKSYEQNISIIKSLVKDMCSLVIYPEGRVYREIYYKESIDYCDEHNLKRLTNVVLPRYKGLYTLLTHSSFCKIYDLTVRYDNTVVSKPFSFSDYINGKSNNMHIYIKEIQLKDIPLDDQNIFKEWLYDLYYTKDKLLDQSIEYWKEDIVERVDNSNDIGYFIASTVSIFLWFYFMITNTNFFLYNIASVCLAYSMPL